MTPHVHFVRDTKIAAVMLKLELCVGFGGSQIRVVPLKAIIGDNGNIVFDMLVGLAISYAFPGAAPEEIEVTVTYTDIDNDCVTISSTQELEDVMGKCVQQGIGTLRLKTCVRRRRSGANIDRCTVQDDYDDVDVTREDALALLTADELEDFKDNARRLLRAYVSGKVEGMAWKGMLELCQHNLQQVKMALQVARKFDQFVNRAELLSFHYFISEIISAVGSVRYVQRNPPLPMEVEPSNTRSTIRDMVLNEDIFSLICMLRAQDERRLDAASALKNFARDKERADLRERIRSLGGVQCLLRVFHTPGVSNDLKVIVALAVAYSESYLSVTSSLMGLKIMSCYSFLVSASQDSQVIEVQDMRIKAVKSVAAFWTNALKPLVYAETRGTEDDIAFATPFTRLRVHPPGSFKQRLESLQTDELLEMTVSLAIQIAKFSDIDEPYRVSRLPLRFRLVKQVCELDVARAISVRLGIVPILLDWLRPGNPVIMKMAACALRDLTSIHDQCMVGRIHAEVATEGPLRQLVRLSSSDSADKDDLLAVAEIFSFLCESQDSRAAVIKANCIGCLVSLLLNHYKNPTSSQVAYHAGRAMIHLASAATNHAKVFNERDPDTNSYSYFATENRGDVLDYMVNRDVIGSFVSIARLKQGGKLRQMAIDALCVMSEDTSLERRTRLILCNLDAAGSLGSIIKKGATDLVENFKPPVGSYHDWRVWLSENEDAVSELHGALVALANILEPIHGNRSACAPFDGSDMLSTFCHQTIESEGIKGLLMICALPHREIRDASRCCQGVDVADLVEEACRALASLSTPLLSHPLLAYSVIPTLAALLGQTSESTSKVLRTNVLRGLSSLAAHEALKTVIADETIPYIFHDRTDGGEGGSSTYNPASDVCVALGLADLGMAAQVSGNDPTLLGDWFCLKRHFLLQAMVQFEIHKAVVATWAQHLEEARGANRIDREDDSQSSASIGSYDLVDMPWEVHDLFKNLTSNNENFSPFKAIIEEYSNMHRLPSCANDVLPAYVFDKKSVGSLSGNVYPLSSVKDEREWILSHGRAASYNFELGQGQLQPHVQRLLSLCFPSRMIQDIVLPIGDLEPDSAFNFRAVMMPQRRYFSFRREGQLISRLCDEEASNLDTATQLHWNLSFTNSHFAGEFVNTLAQALYKCPKISGISFAQDAEWQAVDGGDEFPSANLAELFGSLPHWISHLTFCNVLNASALGELVKSLEAIGQFPSNEPSTMSGEQGENGVAAKHSDGQFRSLAITNSRNISIDVWKSFFGLMGTAGSVGRRKDFPPPPLGYLMVLDLSGNDLGDDGSSLISQLVLSQDSGCHIEQLDISKNNIGIGTELCRILCDYRETQSNQYAETNSQSRPWESSLRVLNLAHNNLFLGNVAIEIIQSLANGTLGLRRLNLSNNALEGDVYAEVLPPSIIENESLRCLDLSGNNFSSQVIDDILNGLTDSATECALSFLLFNSNKPSLTEHQHSKLTSWLERGRRTAIEHFLDARAGEGLVDDFDDESLRNGEGNSITALFSAPLVYLDDNGYGVYDHLDFEMERNILLQCLKEASRDIQLSFDTATHHRLLAAKTKGSTCLHYAGHGHRLFLPFEDGEGGTNRIEVETISRLLQKDGRAPFDLVFVSACDSSSAGRAFVRAGVPHVVCCLQDSELEDTAALAFTQQFYLALFVGRTVKEAFYQGCRAVLGSPNVRDPKAAVSKFVLLPRDGNHNVRVFNARRLREWPSGDGSSSLNMIQESLSPTPPQFFLGRDVDMHRVLKGVLKHRLVSVVGEKGVGRRSLVSKVCHYINARKSTLDSKIECIYFVRPQYNDCYGSFQGLILQLLKELGYHVDDSSSGLLASRIICELLKLKKALIVFDCAELSDGSGHVTEFCFFLHKLFLETTHVRVLHIGRHFLGVPALCELPIQLDPLDFQTSILLFATLCPHLHTRQERKDFSYCLLAKAGVGPHITQRIYDVIGNGFPARIETAAHGISMEDLEQLGKAL